MPIGRGRLGALLDLRWRAPWLLLLAFGLQLALAVFPGPSSWWRLAVHVASFPIGLAWVWLNRQVTGLWVVAAGAALNGIAIAANGGVMPASAQALRTAGLPAHTANLANSDVVADPRLSFLGDVFAIPASWPFANVFSIGDVLIALGAAIAIHAVCGSHLVPERWRRPAVPSGA